MKNFLMIDTETFGDSRYDTCGEKNLYEFGFTLVLKGQVSITRAYLCRDSIEYAESVYDETGYFPTYFPDRIARDFDAYIARAIDRINVADVICRAIDYARKNRIAIVAKNPAFDCAVLEKYMGFNLLDVSECRDMQAMLVKALPKKYAFSVPHTSSGLATFRADYLVPFMLGSDFVQAHDAGGDSLNQALIVLKLAKRKQGKSNSTQVFQMMQEFHARLNIPLYSGTFTLPKNGRPKKVKKG